MASMRNVDDMIHVLTAYKSGKTIQTNCCGTWYDLSEPYPSWNFNANEYRVKPEPREPREFWINQYKDFGISSSTREKADECAAWHRRECIHVREVLE